jgi:hypothetical protein
MPRIRPYCGAVIRRLIPFVTLVLIACSTREESIVGENSESETAQSLQAGRIPECTGLPGIDRSRDAWRIQNDRGWIIPAYPRAGEEIFVAFRAPRGHWARAYVRHTQDGWRTQRDDDLRLWCDQPEDPYQLIGHSLGRFSAGTRIDLAVAMEPANRRFPTEWYNLDGRNYQLYVGDQPNLQWVGDTHVRIGTEVIHPDLAPAGHDLQIYTQTYPSGPMQVELFYADADFTRVESVVMELERDGAGSNNNNAQWRATIPASNVLDGQTLHYWIRASDAHGAVHWDSRNGANYQLTPRHYAVVWAGGFGQYRPTDDSYREGFLFQPDGSTSLGCYTHGASVSSYVVRAVRVYIPGLTDQTDVPPAALSILRAELYTNLTENNGGWRSTPARFAKKQGNDFIYTFLAFEDLCGGGIDPAEQRYPNNTYAMKLRFSTDGGRNWFWRGLENGPVGGADIPVLFRARCGYFGDPNDCMP